MSKNLVESVGPQMTSQYGAYALNAVSKLTRTHMPTRPGIHMYARTRKHTQTNM